MAAPSNLPSAAKIAADAKTEYDSRYGGVKPPLPVGIEDQAELFFQARELGVYLSRYHPSRRPERSEAPRCPFAPLARYEPPPHSAV